MVPVLLGGGAGVGPGDPGRGRRVLPLAADRGEADGPALPLWWTLRRPFRQLTYHAALRMFTRAGAALGAGWTLHDLRTSAPPSFTWAG